MNQDQFDTVITSERSSLGAQFKELWRSRDLIALLIKRNFVSTYAQSILGPLWIFINPLITSVIFTFVFGQYAGIATDGLPHILFYLAGNTMWGLCSHCASSNARVFVSNRDLFSKVYFSRLNMVLATSLTAVANFLIQFSMILIFYAYYLIIGEPIMITWRWLLLPVLILQSMLLGTSVGMFVAALSVRYRDFMYMVGFGVQLWMYATPIVYPLTSNTESIGRTLLLINPMTAVVQNFRTVLYNQGEFLGLPWLISGAVTLAMFFASLLLLQRAEKDMIDLV